MELLQLSHDTFSFHCPFNPSHTMPHKTVMKHIAKCPDRPPNFRNCPFNVSHVMHESELREHEENCPNRILIDTAVFESEDISRPKPVIHNMPEIEYDESWDGHLLILEDTSDVLTDIKKSTIPMKAKHGSTKSERKRHRLLLHEHDIFGNDDVEPTEPSIAESEAEVEEKKVPTPLFIGKRPSMRY